jgi:hypothetical protein
MHVDPPSLLFRDVRRPIRGGSSTPVVRENEGLRVPPRSRLRWSLRARHADKSYYSRGLPSSRLNERSERAASSSLLQHVPDDGRPWTSATGTSFRKRTSPRE